MRFDLHIRVATSAKAATFIELIDGEAQLLDMKAVPDDDVSKHSRKKMRYINGAKNKGISASELMLQLLADGRTHNRQEIERSFEARNFAGHTAPSCVSRLKSAGLVEILPEGYRIVKKAP